MYADVARVRKRHVQQELALHGWGGARARAGRKQVNERKSQPHRARRELAANQPVLVTLRVAQSVRRMRRRDAYRAIRNAMKVVLARTDFRIVHLSIQANHVHMLVEADTKLALARGMQAFQISAARRLNAVDLDGAGRARRGVVFPDRYHCEALRTPTRVRRALSYVLNNWRKHREDRVPATRTWVIDPYSSARSFLGWYERAAWIERGDMERWMVSALGQVPSDLEVLPVCSAQSWLLREGWRRSGGVSAFETPSERSRQRAARRERATRA
jgi:REP element-mobilizing transposase RayT